MRGSGGVSEGSFQTQQLHIRVSMPPPAQGFIHSVRIKSLYNDISIKFDFLKLECLLSLPNVADDIFEASWKPLTVVCFCTFTCFDSPSGLLWKEGSCRFISQADRSPFTIKDLVSQFLSKNYMCKLICWYFC